MLDWNNNGISIALQNNNADTLDEDANENIDKEKNRKGPYKCILFYISRKFRQIQETLEEHVLLQGQACI